MDDTSISVPCEYKDNQKSQVLLTDKQQEALFALLQHGWSQPQLSNPTTINPPTQIQTPASGASDHVSSSLDNFYSYHHIEPVLVTLPNNSQIITNIAGQDYLEDDWLS
ncbi:hypothetical protein PIB30_047107 [Stylosanthes scabra]|uniref:Uncharacterized protein n=1 Tax=Stylosanthes scabra TaxID=79078 RepID=A0ABU6QG90_9FABA|nr:hypothetical protein [Stylosanthes scabra]